MTSTTLVALLFGLAGMALVVGSTVCFKGTRRFLCTSAATTGTVKRLLVDDDMSPDGDVYYRVLVEFADSAGRPVEVTWPTGTTPPPYRIGQQVPILYDTHRPQHATINSLGSIWFWVLTLFGLGAAFAGGGIALFVTR